MTDVAISKGYYSAKYYLEIATAPLGPRNDTVGGLPRSSYPCHCEERSDAAISRQLVFSYRSTFARGLLFCWASRSWTRMELDTMKPLGVRRQRPLSSFMARPRFS